MNKVEVAGEIDRLQAELDNLTYLYDALDDYSEYPKGSRVKLIHSNGITEYGNVIGLELGKDKETGDYFIYPVVKDDKGMILNTEKRPPYLIIEVLDK